MSEKISTSAQKVQEALKVHGVTCQVIEMKQTTRSAQDAADAVGCQVGQIAKSLIFTGKKSNQPILVIASGPNRVNEKQSAGTYPNRLPWLKSSSCVSTPVLPSVEFRQSVTSIRSRHLSMRIFSNSRKFGRQPEHPTRCSS